MRTFTLLGLLSCFLYIVSALPVYSLTTGSAVGCQQKNCLDADAPLIYERARRKRNTPRRPANTKVTFRHDHNPHSAGATLAHLNLSPKHRKIVEDYHVGLVKSRMKTIPGAKTAEIINLAHARGSPDPHVHISVQYKNHAGNVIAVPREGNPNIHSQTVHLYTNPKNKADGVSVLPKVYRDAVKAHQIRTHGRFLGI